MRKTALLLVIAVYGFAANAQLTLRAQAGIENPLTKISYNHLPSFVPTGHILPQLGVSADYSFKSGFGPFLGLFTHLPLVNYQFTDPATGMASYHASTGDLLLQLQAGLQYNTKALPLSKKSSSSGPAEKPTAKHDCSHFSSGCCHRRSSTSPNLKTPTTWNLRLQPAVGIAYHPFSEPDMVIKNSGTSTSYMYHAGNIRPELLAGVGFEFARNTTRILSFRINYFKGFGNPETTFTTESSAKNITTTLSSKVSGWNATVGIPISFSKKSTTKVERIQTKPTEYDSPKLNNEYYHRRCGGHSRVDL